MSNFRKLIVVLLVLAAGVGAYQALRPGAFNARKLADAELRMWKAYYEGKHQEMGKEIMRALQVQFGLTFTQSFDVARPLARAAVGFQGASGNYEAAALPDLRQAYTTMRDLTGGTWDPDQAARAELEWWVKRRTPGHDTPEEVGRSIAHLYAVLYGHTNPDIERAGLLRAQAADLRDRHGDWDEIGQLLRESYRLLVKGVEQR